MPHEPSSIYYEEIGSEFLLCLSGNIKTFHSLAALQGYVSQLYPDCELASVDDDNWQDLYDAGAFDS